MARGCSNHSYKVSVKLRFQNIFCLKQITSCKGSGFYLVYNLLLGLLLFLCANWKVEDWVLAPTRGTKFVCPISPMFRCVFTEHDFFLFLEQSRAELSDSFAFDIINGNNSWSDMRYDGERESVLWKL
jgi:hypothetical protein